MNVYHDSDNLALLVGDCREQLNALSSGFARTCVTSPPYWGLRDYGVEGQIGLEQTPQEYVEQVALAETCILAGSAQGDVVVDPFCGAGTTGLAAIKHCRSFVGAELNAAYAALAVERWK